MSQSRATTIDRVICASVLAAEKIAFLMDERHAPAVYPIQAIMYRRRRRLLARRCLA